MQILWKQTLKTILKPIIFIIFLLWVINVCYAVDNGDTVGGITVTEPSTSVQGSSGDPSLPWHPPVEIPAEPTPPPVDYVPPKPVTIPLNIIGAVVVGSFGFIALFGYKTHKKRQQPSQQRAAKTWADQQKKKRKLKWPRKKKALDEL